MSLGGPPIHRPAGAHLVRVLPWLTQALNTPLEGAELDTFDHREGGGKVVGGEDAISIAFQGLRRRRVEKSLLIFWEDRD